MSFYSAFIFILSRNMYLSFFVNNAIHLNHIKLSLVIAFVKEIYNLSRNSSDARILAPVLIAAYRNLFKYIVLPPFELTYISVIHSSAFKNAYTIINYKRHVSVYHCTPSVLHLEFKRDCICQYYNCNCHSY